MFCVPSLNETKRLALPSEQVVFMLSTLSIANSAFSIRTAIVSSISSGDAPGNEFGGNENTHGGT